MGMAITCMIALIIGICVVVGYSVFMNTIKNSLENTTNNAQNELNTSQVDENCLAYCMEYMHNHSGVVGGICEDGRICEDILYDDDFR